MEKNASFRKPDAILKAGMYEYLLVANPDKSTCEAVSAEQQYFCDHYQEKMAVPSKPHITVAKFLAREEMEETICRWIQRISGQQKSFEVMLNNFSGIPLHKIYIRVQNVDQFKALGKGLQAIDQYLVGNDFAKMDLIKNPHITLAKQLSAGLYQKAMIDYSQRYFTGSFIITELILLKRRHQFENCQRVNVFSFLPEVTYATGYELLAILND